jgi:hypothetical protein
MAFQYSPYRTMRFEMRRRHWCKAGHSRRPRSSRRTLAVVERHRGRLARAMVAEMRTLKLLRELARPEAQAPGPLVQPFLVEVRVLGPVRAGSAG